MQNSKLIFDRSELVRNLFRTSMVSLLVSLAFGIFCQAANAQESIKSFDVLVICKKDASVDVTETINYDFGTALRHGIFRNLPVTYSRYGGNYTVDFRLIDVVDENGKAQKVHVAQTGRDVNIRIGDAHKTLTGRHFYKIHYVVRRAINFFEGAPEFYWNATGSEWPVPIESATVRLYPPEGTQLNHVRFKSFHGRTGSTQPTEARPDSSNIVYSCGRLEPGEDFTIVAGFPKGAMIQPTLWSELQYWLADWWPAMAIPSFSALAVWLLWFHYGRDEIKLGSIAVEWNPPTQMTPAEVGTLVDEQCDNQDIVATLIDLAARGHLKIREIKKPAFLGFGDADYEFTKTDPVNDELKLRSYEQRFLRGIFGYDSKFGDKRILSDLKYNFYTEIPYLRDEIYGALTNEEYFRENPETVRKQYRALGIFIGFIGVLMMVGSSSGAALMPIGLGLLGSAAIVCTFAFAMPARTEKGIQALRQTLGFSRFVDKAEKRRMEVLIEEDPTIFGRMLPYAMVLGAADKWAGKFENLMTEPPNWYEPYGYNRDYVFTPRSLVNDLGYGMRSMQSTMLSSPPSTSSSAGSGGSGFSGGSSGGGFGGGGGGSW